MEICIACGMPMEEESDYAGGDPANDYCKFCSRPDGSMQSFEEKANSLTEFIVRTQGLDESVARDMALTMMAELPAWRTRMIAGD